MTFPREGWVHLDSWAGRTRHRVTVLGEAREGAAYRVRWEDETCLKKKRGRIYYPPKSAVTFDADTRGGSDANE